MASDRQPDAARSTPQQGVGTVAGGGADVPIDVMHGLERERDNLLVLHEALADVERASTRAERLRVLVDAIRQVGYGRVMLTLRDADLNATMIVCAGLSAGEERFVNDSPAPGHVWQRRLASIERFRISNSYYLDGTDPWVVEEFGRSETSANGALLSTLAPIGGDGWSPHDTLVVPLRAASGRVIATLVLDDPDDRARPSLTRVRTVELFARQVGAMLAQETLRDLAERRAVRLQKLHEAGSQLARSLDESTILRTLARQTENVLPGATVLVHAVDEEGVALPVVFQRGREEADPGDAPASMRTLGVLAAETQRVTATDGCIAVPALLAGAVAAVLVVQPSAGERIDAGDTELLLTIGTQAAAAVGNARLYAESQRQRRQTEALADVARAVGESLRLDSVLRLILRHAIALLRTEGATIGLLRGDTVEIVAGSGAGEMMVGTRYPLFGSMSGRAIRTGASIIGDDVRLDPDTRPGTLETAQIRNTIIVPLSSVNGPVGVLTVFNRADAFAVDDAEVLHRLADQVAMAVVNARLFEEVAEGTREWAVAFDAIGSGMVLLDREGRIQRSNARARVLMGVTEPDAIVGHTFHGALFGEPGSCDACVHMTAIRENTVVRGTHGVRSRGLVYDITAAPHPLGGAVVTFDDVTEHRALAERYRRVVETSSDAIVITDRDHRIAFANPAAIALFGRGPDLVGQPAAITVPTDMLELVRDREDRALAGEPQWYEAAVERPGGDRRVLSITTAPLRELGEVTGIVASLRDVTEERVRVGALARSEARYSRLVESASDGIFTLNAEGRFTAVNRSFERAVGRERASLLGETFTGLIDPRDVPAAQRLLLETIAGERCRGQLRYRSANGDTRHGAVITSPIVEDEVITGALGIMRDMTDEIRLADQLLQQEKLAAVGQLVSGVAHELNNPLAGVMAFSQLLLASPAARDPEARRAAETIHREAQRAAKIVSHLLTFARQQPAERTETDLNVLVADTLELRRHALRSAGVEIVLALDPALPRSWADPFQLQQVLLNLLVNAEQALAAWDGPRRITVRTSRAGDQLELSVADTGPGIALEKRDRIFNPFFTTKPVGQGTGLGLSISDGIAREHGGRIRVESQPGEGATFILEIPYSEVPAVPATPAAQPISAPTRPCRVLVVDDEPSMRSAMSTFLRSLGHEVTVASGGFDARRLLADTEYDAILLDLRMGDVSGDVLYHELRTRDPRQAARVVFVTGDTQSDAARRFLTEAGRPSLSKPFQLDDLATVIAAVTH
jgi:PAS domain S-box-containing protein